MRQEPLSLASGGRSIREMGTIWILLILLHITVVPFASSGVSLRPRLVENDNEEDAKLFLEKYNEEYGRLANLYVLADWDYNTNLTHENAEKSTAAYLALAAYNDEAFKEADEFDSSGFSFDTKRQLSKVGSKGLSDEEMKKLSEIISQMGSIYGQAKVCRGEGEDKECLPLEPDLTKLMAESVDESERLWAWEGWREVVGRQVKPLYMEYAELKNKLAKVNGYDDYGDQLRKKYETETFETDIAELYKELEPLYKELHAYVRRKLYNVYGEVVDLKGPIPQHLLGDMWGRFWTNLYFHVVPFPDRPPLDVTKALVDQKYNATRMFRTGEEFYTSLGLIPLPDTFFNLSMIEKPNDREVLCHATAWDFFDGKDYRIKMCTSVNFLDFLTIHHELGHVQYFMQYADKPILYRDGANDGFHEAVGELMSMCVSTPKHLYAIGLLEELLEDKESELNYLLSVALKTVSTLPFHYVMDLWRWKAFRNEFPEVEWNSKFWEITQDIVGVNHPVPRTPEDLDAPTIFHVALDYDMIRYFTRTILQFQFAETLCSAAGQEGPLNQCDFYGSKPAGDKLAEMLKMGSSKPWPEALKALTGESLMSARAIRSYFEPLENYLRVINWFNNDTPGWTKSNTMI